jgi:hypothetical protein
MPLTELGHDKALKALRDRRAHKPERIDNASLYAGSPMYFYCVSCGHLADVLPEGYLSRPKQLCDECAALKEMGWLE